MTAALAAAGVLAACSLAATSVLVVAALWRIATNAYGATGDFISFFVAGTMVRTGDAAHLYDAGRQEALQRATYPGEFDLAVGYPLPVFAAWIFAPLSLMPFTAAFLLWIALNAVLLAILAVVFWKMLRGVPATPRTTFVAAFAASMPAVAAIVFGQVDLLVMASLIGAYVLMAADRKLAAGAVLALALIKPHFAIGVVLMLLVWREWRVLGSFGAIGGPLLILPALLSSPSSLVDNVLYLRRYPDAGKQLSVNADMMANWRGFTVSVTNQNDLWLWLPGMALVALAAMLIALRVYRRGPADVGLGHSWALAVTLPLLLSPHLHTQSLVLLFFAQALMLRQYARQGDVDWDVPIMLMLVQYTALFVCWFAGTMGIATLGFVVIASYAMIALRWPAGAIVERRTDELPRAA